MKILLENDVAHETDNFGENMEIKSDISIKDDIIAVIEESIKFALLAIILLFVVGTPLLYLLIKFTKIDVEVAAMLTGVIVAVLIVVIDEKKIQAHDKTVECNRRIIRKVLKFARKSFCNRV
jgi:hypothetical protein